MRNCESLSPLWKCESSKKELFAKKNFFAQKFYLRTLAPRKFDFSSKSSICERSHFPKVRKFKIFPDETRQLAKFEPISPTQLQSTKKSWYFTYRRQNGHISHCVSPFLSPWFLWCELGCPQSAYHVECFLSHFSANRLFLLDLSLLVAASFSRVLGVGSSACLPGAL